MNAVSQTLDTQLSLLGAEIQAFLESLPSQIQRERFEDACRHCRRLLDRLPSVAAPADRFAPAWANVSSALAQLEDKLATRARAAAHRAYEDAARAYEHWLASWRAAHAPEAPESLAPLMGARTWFHMSMGVLAMGMYQFVLSRGQALAVLSSLLAVFGTLEITRRVWPRWNEILVRKVFHSIARPREFHRVNSATWYLVALVLVTPLFSRAAVLTGVLVLAFGDPAAAWIGRRYGSIKLHGRKSLQGSLAFLAAGAIAAAAYLLALQPGEPVARRLAAAGLAALVGAAAELFARRLDDNLTVPVASVLAAALFV